MIAGQGAGSGECSLRRGGAHDGVGASGVDVKWDSALMIVGAGSMNHAGQDDTLSVGDLLVEDLKVGGLRVAAVPEGVADGSKVLGAAVRAGEHDDRSDPCELPPSALADHPGQKPLQDEAALAVRHECDARRSAELGRVLGCKHLGEVIEIWDTSPRGEGAASSATGSRTNTT